MIMAKRPAAINSKRTQKNISIDEYRKKLLLKIAGASSEENVRRYIDTAIKAMHTKKVNGHLVARFIEKVSDQLNDDITEKDQLKKKNYAIARSMIPIVRKQLFG
jgi:hypothetical protein